MPKTSLQSFKRLKKKTIPRMAADLSAPVTSVTQFSRIRPFRKRHRVMLKKLQSIRASARSLMRS